MTAVANGFRHVLKPVVTSTSSSGYHNKSAVVSTNPAGQHTNASNGHLSNGHHAEEKPSFAWTVGLINSKKKLLTAETFGNKVNVTGTSLRKKQLWLLVPGKEDNVVALKSHLGKFLSLDQYGNINCEADVPADGEWFTIIQAADNTGRWALRNEKHQYFLTGDGEKVSGKSKANPETDLWTVHLTTHPICTLRSIGRKRFARVRGDEIHCCEDVPWGQEALISLEFTPQHHYMIKTYCTGLYLNRNGKLILEPDADLTAYTLIYHAGQVAFKDRTGKFLSPFGNEAILRGKNATVTKSELFILEHAQPQCSLLAHNGRAVSIRQGIDLSANQDSLSEKEIFQLECDKEKGNWRLRTCQNKYWSLVGTNGLQASGDAGTDGGAFELVYPANGRLALRSVKNGKFIVVRPTGHLFAQSDSVQTAEHFQLLMANRPVLGLRCAYGFVGLKSSSSNKLECNKSIFEAIKLENAADGAVSLQASNGLYVDVGDDGSLNADSKDPKSFFIQLKETGRITLKTPNGYYATAEQTGLVKAAATEQNATEWEY